MNTPQDDNEQMEYLCRQNEKKKQQIARRKERRCVIWKKVKALFLMNSR